MSEWVLGASAAAFALMGLAAIIEPSIVTAQFGAGLLKRAGRSEVRAVYGGFGLAICAALVFALRDPELRPGVSLTVGLALAGMACGRVVSLVLDRGIDKLPLLYLLIEALAAAALLYAT